MRNDEDMIKGLEVIFNPSLNSRKSIPKLSCVNLTVNRECAVGLDTSKCNNCPEFEK